jgi:hypothetical protein
MKNYVPMLAASLILANACVCLAQQPSGYQPYTPTVVGGLPPSSKGLEQPVFVADRTFEPSLSTNMFLYCFSDYNLFEGIDIQKNKIDVYIKEY